MLNRRPWGPLCWVLAFFTASYQQLLRSPNSIGVPECPFGWEWLSLPHLIYNSLSNSNSNWNSTVWLLSWLSYIIVQRPLDRPLDLWNRMFDHHQAEITVMQFTGHSLPVHQSECIIGFTSSHFISQIHPRDLFRFLAIGMCYFLPVYHFVMACLLGPKVKIQHQITILEMEISLHNSKRIY